MSITSSVPQASQYNSNGIARISHHNSISSIQKSMTMDITNVETLKYKGKEYEVEKLFKMIDKMDELMRIHFPEILL